MMRAGRREKGRSTMYLDQVNQVTPKLINDALLERGSSAALPSVFRPPPRDDQQLQLEKERTARRNRADSLKTKVGT